MREPGKHTIRSKKFRQLRGAGRWFKYKYLLLFRAKGGPAMVAKGFSIGLAVEMFTLPTFGLAFFLIFPLVKMFRASLASALIGFVFGKVIYVPLSFLINKVGGLALPKNFYRNLHHALPQWLDLYLRVSFKLIVGGMIVGTALGIILYFPLKYLLEMYTAKRKEKRRRKAQLVLSESEK